MRQYMLNGWLVAALVALTCLLGITAYAEVKTDLPRTASLGGSGDMEGQGAMCDLAPCDGIARNA
ncbi:hypothetical protein [Mesorhizobium sp.]|uniref:hypothetical protein n=1 Tax=Mesorhizobium sp. TaxID=1871066 RepID=UPI000FE6A4CC|nr:hypothetical protein [Mesorhizobium sp.]RWL96837.1 MAG: hypothetical protein EOR71_32475 [Mesorhizobium sp.]